MRIRAVALTLFPIIAILMVASAVAQRADARTIRLSLSFEQPTIQPAPIDGNEIIVTAPGCETFNDPGLPMLPARRAVVLIPPGEEVRAVRAIPSPARALQGSWRVACAPTPQPISLVGPAPAIPANAEIYGSDAPYPASAFRLVTEQVAWGHRLAFFQVRPVVYRPQSGALEWSDHITLEVDTAPIPGADPSRIENLRTDADVETRLASLVDNAQDLDLYAGAFAARSRDSRLTPDNYPYVIVTVPDLASGYMDLARFESSRGLRAKLVLLGDVLPLYPGRDDPEKLRNFIKDAYQSWGTRYVMLGGDSDVVPIRNLYDDANGTIDAFPGDCYYEALDGDWNGDGDDVWGEWNNDNVDLAGELAVGRITARDLTDLGHVVHKVEMYTDHPVVSEVRKALFMGERMDDNPTYSGCYMDRVKDYSCDFGYCTSGYPLSAIKRTLYDSPSYTWSASDAIAIFNAGYPTSHHLGHANTTYGMKMGNSDVQYFTNDGVTHSYMFVYTQGCDSGNFDNPSTPSISEVFENDEHCCAAFIGNSRYGWYCPGWCTGPSQHYDRQIVNARYGHGLPRIGDMNVQSKIDNIWQEDVYNIWCHYELNILGDPAMPQWKEVIGALAVSHSGTYVIGQGDYAVTVTSSGSPVAGATVSIWSDDLESSVSAVTNAQGVAMLNPNPSDPSALHVKAIKENYLPASADIYVDPGQQPWLYWSATTLDDDMNAPSIGDGDGMADMGETIQYVIRLRNIGHVPAGNVAAVLSCADPRVSIADSTASYGTIDGLSEGVNQDDFIVRVTNNMNDGDVVHFSILMDCDGPREYSDHFDITLHAPVISLSGWRIDDSQYGDGRGDMDPGEQFKLRVTLANTGSDGARAITATLTPDNAYAQILTGASGITVIPAAGAAEFDPSFEYALNVRMPTEAFIRYTLHATTWCGLAYDTAFDVRVHSYFEDILETESGWRVGAPDDNATAGVWTRVAPIGTWRVGRPVKPGEDHTPDPEGTMCFVTGQGGQGSAVNYDLDGGKTTLTSSMIDLRTANDPHLVYWRWYTNNQGNFPNEDHWQADVSDDDGATWHSLEYTTQSNDAWQRMDFRLLDHVLQTANVRIRFIASDLYHESLVEAAVDDISIESSPGSLSGVEENGPARAIAFGIHNLSPNPAQLRSDGLGASAVSIDYAVPRSGPVHLQIYDVRGRLVRTLVDGTAAAGEYRAGWNGRDSAGHPAAGGIYFCRLRANGREAVRKVVLIDSR